MKIFNWIHRNRIPYNPHPVEASVPEGSSGRRSGSSIQDAKAEKEPLLEEEVKAASDWELDGILTIGTLAIDPLQQNTMNDGQEEENDYHDEVMAGTKLLNEIFSHKHSVCETEEVEETEMVMYKKLTDLEMGMRRVTLLDLFMADELPHQKQGQDGHRDCSVVLRVQEEDVAVDAKKKKKIVLYNKIAAAVGGRKGSKPKKTQDDVPALKKLQRFMTRMMKKKIHPDMEGKKGQVMKLNDDVSVPSNDQYHAQLTESVYLLPTQGIMA